MSDSSGMTDLMENFTGQVTIDLTINETVDLICLLTKERNNAWATEHSNYLDSLLEKFLNAQKTAQEKFKDLELEKMIG